MIITVQGTPEECKALCDALKGVQLPLSSPLSVNVLQISKTPLTLMQGGKSDDDRRTVELPPII